MRLEYKKPHFAHLTTGISLKALKTVLLSLPQRAHVNRSKSAGDTGVERGFGIVCADGEGIEDTYDRGFFALTTMLFQSHGIRPAPLNSISEKPASRKSELKV